MKIRLASALGLLAALLLCACSAPQLSYNRLDWIVSWQLGKYLDLDATQQQRFDARFEALWDWHRGLELARYAADLRTLAAEAAQPQDAAAIERWTQRIEAHWQRLLDRIAEPACAELRTLSDAQVQSMLERIDRNTADARKEYVEPGAAAAREAAAERLDKTLHRWLGELDEPQRREVDAWHATRELDYADWIARRVQWRGRYAAALALRGEAGFCGELDALFGRTPPPRSAADTARRAAWMAFIARLSTSLGPRQREHLRKELLGLAQDFEALAAQSKP